uniref:Aminopeptidase N n=1 Tax=Mamestra brassicae TaxID=55057 RepID=A0A096XIT2_MAMBR|nr:aminopeptidase N [Mamestra brassicae]
MAAIKLIVLSLAYICATAIADVALRPVTRNTIFTDERFEGEVFENVDAFDDIELSSGAVSPFRLPTTTRPSNYRVHWNIDLVTLRYSGTVVITLSATQANVNEIVIHSDHTTLTSVVLRQGTTIIQSNHTLQQEYQFLRVTLNEGVLQYNAVNPVQYTLTINFNANMRDDMYGIYHSWYRNVGTDSAIRWMATTQFQATAARYAFPCYDEPSFKATFDVTITRAANLKSWFCTLRSSTSVSTDPNYVGYENDVYHTTPIMSTYLLALIVADYSAVQFPVTGVVRHEVIARPGAIYDGQGDYAQETGQALLAWMNTHTNYDFFSQNANLKMTQAAIPDFGAGAMENWGLLTYREAYLLYTQQHTNSYFKQLIAYILSHEIAHMWFGNLVTNDWWDVLWLNEGFARYYQYFLTAAVVDMGLATRFITEQVHTSLLSDSSDHPHPLTNPGVGSPASVSAMFSTITYNKGAAVIRMTEHLLGSDVHRQGLRNYLREKDFSTVKPIDLFNNLDLAGRSAGAFNAYGTEFNFVDYYKSWTEQPGHPVLQVTINHRTGQMTIYQRRFNINTGYSRENTKYIIPITFTSAPNIDFTNTKPSHILTKAVTVIDRNAYGDHWTILNVQQAGFYRVNYDNFTWDLITRALRGNDRPYIHEYNRAQIVNDVFQFARSGIMSYERAMNILSFLEFETAYAPWVAAITGFNWVRARLHGEPELAELNRRIIQWSLLAITQLTYYPIANEDFMRSYLRYQLAPVLCNLGVEGCLNAAYTQFDQLRTAGIEVPVDSRNWVYCNALRRGNAEDFNFLWTRFRNHNVYTEKILLLQTLGCTSDDASLRTFVDAIVQSNNLIRRQDYTTAFNTAVSGNEANTQKVFQYIQQNLAAVIHAFGNARTPLSYVSARLRTEAEVIAFQTWANNTRSILDTSYALVYSDAENTLESIRLSPAIANDLNNFFENGLQEFTTTPVPASTAAPATSARPVLVEPVTPGLPDSAVSTFASIFLLAIAAVAHIIL